MPTIKQLPAATAVGGNDLLPVSQNGLTRSTAISTLLSNTQPLLSLAQGTLLGRVSIGLGAPEAVNVGTGLSVQTGTVLADATDHIGLTLSTSLLADDEVIINSGATPRRLAANKLRSLFTAGSGVQIDASGVISATSTSSNSGGATTAGPKGDTGAAGPAGQGFAFRAAWQANTGYSAYDVVTFGGQTYVATSSISAASAFSAGSWSLLAAQGATGSAGAAGATGPQGPAGPIVAATSSAIGAVKPGTGLTIAADGAVSISNVSLSSIAQGAATVGQLLGWNGTGWAPTTAASGVSYTGLSPISVASGTISIAQSGATAGQVLAWSGSAWQPASPAASGTSVGTATPLVNGVATAGTAMAASREDHRHPTDATRAPLAGPVFTGAITLPIWTTSTRPNSPTIGMEGYATDTARRETYTAAGWIQHVRLADIPAASRQLLGGTNAAGTAASVAIGTGLSLVSGTLSATGSTSVTAISGVSIDGNTIPASASAPYQMLAADRVVDVNKISGTPAKILLPTSPVLWVDYTIIDGKGDAGTNNITVTGSSGMTINGSSSFVMNANNDAVSLRAVNATTWRVV